MGKNEITMKKILLTFMMLAGIVSVAWAQVDDVTLVVNGEGVTKDEATTKALRSAIEQAFGVFVSANTEILNDELVKDEIVAVSTGNVRKYKELGSVVKPNGLTEVTLSATVSVKKITSYAISHGSSAEFAGATFAANMKLRALNRKNCEEAIAHLFRTIHELGDDIWDCEIKVGDIKSTGEVPVTLKYYANEKAKVLSNIIRETLISLSVSNEEVEMMKKAGEKYYSYSPLGFGRDIRQLTFYCEVTDKERARFMEKKYAKYKPIQEKLNKISSLPNPCTEKTDRIDYVYRTLSYGDWEMSRYYTKGKIFEIYDNLGNNYKLQVIDPKFESGYLKYVQKASQYVNLSFMKDSDGDIDQQKLYIGANMPEIISIYNDHSGNHCNNSRITVNEAFSGGTMNYGGKSGLLLAIKGTITIPIDRIEKISNLYVK